MSRSSRSHSFPVRWSRATTNGRMMSDLRESGSIEQDADVVLFVYREEYYLSKTEPEPRLARARCSLGGQARRCSGDKAEVIIAKQRHGPTGTANLHFQGEFTRFSDLAADEYLPERHE